MKKKTGVVKEATAAIETKKKPHFQIKLCIRLSVLQYRIISLIFITLYKMGELSSELIGTHCFHVEEEWEN